MKRIAVVLIGLMALTVLALPAEAYHWHYYHPLWGLGWWPQPSPQPQVYIQRLPEQPAHQIVWYW